jgi:hypothetical protein
VSHQICFVHKRAGIGESVTLNLFYVHKIGWHRSVSHTHTYIHTYIHTQSNEQSRRTCGTHATQAHWTLLCRHRHGSKTSTHTHTHTHTIKRAKPTHLRYARDTSPALHAHVGRPSSSAVGSGSCMSLHTKFYKRLCTYVVDCLKWSALKKLSVESDVSRWGDHAQQQWAQGAG